jgi:hypothetical protein
MSRTFTHQSTSSSRESIRAIRKFLRSFQLPSKDQELAQDDVCPTDILTDETDPAADSTRHKQLRAEYAHWLMLVPVAATLVPSTAHAAELEQTLTNLVNSFTGRLLPILALGYLGKNIFSHIQGDPNAKHETIRVVIATACLLGLGGVWNYISQQAR